MILAPDINIQTYLLTYLRTTAKNGLSVIGGLFGVGEVDGGSLVTHLLFSQQSGDSSRWYDLLAAKPAVSLPAAEDWSVTNNTVWRTCM